MNIDILNAYCGIGLARCHICLRVGSLSLALARSALFRAACRPLVRGALSCRRPSRAVVASNRDASASRRAPTHVLTAVHAARGLRVARGRTVARLVDLSGSSPPRRARHSRCSRPTRCRRHFFRRPEIRRDYPLNLSISLSGGKETNKDSPSNGE